MEFARKVWKLLVGIKDALVLLLLLVFFMGLYALLSGRPGAAAVHKGALVIDLSGTVVEEPSVPDPLTMLVSQQAPTGQTRARDVVLALRAAAKDDRINSVVLDLSGFMGGGLVHLEEIGQALDQVRAAHKKVFAYGVAYFDSALLLAAHSDEAWIDPQGTAVVTGPGGNRLYYKGLLDKLKIDVNIYRVGTFKSAVEPYFLTGPSPASQEADKAYLSAMWQSWKQDVAKARPNARVEEFTSDPVGWLKAHGSDPAEAAKAAGLIDRIGSRTDFDLRVQQVAGKDPRGQGLGDFAHTDLKPWLAANPEDDGGKAIGVVTIAGDVVDGNAGPGAAGADRITGILEDALDKHLAALVVRVDSPGGSLMAAENIREAIARFTAKGIPVVTSMANLGASGGYWVAMPSSRIFAEPATITGSIGVFAVLPTFDKALNRIGVTGGGVKTTPLSGQPDFLNGFTPEVGEMFQATIDNDYGKFVGLVAKSRKISAADAPNWAEGRPWSGVDAKRLGLVDQFGGLDDALAYAAGKAGLKPGEWHAEYLGRKDTGTLGTILAMLGGSRSDASGANSGDFLTMAGLRQSMVFAQIRKTLAMLTGAPGVQVYCTECPPTYEGVGAGSGEGTSRSDELSLLARLRALMAI